MKRLICWLRGHKMGNNLEWVGSIHSKCQCERCGYWHHLYW
jgi:hypothetical protein